MDLLPVNLDVTPAGSIFGTTAVKTIHLSVPDDLGVSGVSPTPDGSVQQHWMQAFHRSSQSTLQRLSFQGSAPSLDNGPNGDIESDLQKSVTSILASGLPLPKSPSIQSDERALGKWKDSKQQEREERGWWSLRFEQVLREMQRQDYLIM